MLTLRALASTTLEQYEAFHIYYQPLICLVAMLWLWAGNVRYFEWRNLRYDLCFSAGDQRFLLSSRQLFQVRRLRAGPCWRLCGWLHVTSRQLVEQQVHAHARTQDRLLQCWHACAGLRT